ncbi:MAG TPA: hypothetical protein VHN82_00840 [Methanoregula sp.]|nr:hypothetical protein [Methanoregula sp.]
MCTVSDIRIWRIIATLALLSLALIAVTPVSADVIHPDNPTKIFFAMNGSPVHDTVNFTVTCYGAHANGASPPAVTSSPPERVFWLSGTCPSYGCVIFEKYLNLDRLRIDTCNLEGDRNGEHFIIRNFADTPRPNCTSLHQNKSLQQQIWKEYLACSERISTNFSSESDPAAYETRQQYCTDHYKEEIARNNLILTNLQLVPADEICYLNFSIPSERYVPTPTPTPISSSRPAPSSLTLYGVLISVIFAGGLAVLFRKKLRV